MADQMLDTKQAAAFLNLQPQTLTQWRWRGVGPAYIAVSHTCVRYRLSDLEAWLEAHSVKPSAGKDEGTSTAVQG